jgi:hypothetical protein
LPISSASWTARRRTPGWKASPTICASRPLYNGILTLANIALRASGFRVSLGQGHHQRVIESLEYTLTTQDATARERWVRKIKSHSQKRNTTSYDLAGGISSTELAQVTKDLTALREQVKAWLKEAHPEFHHDDSHQS